MGGKKKKTKNGRNDSHPFVSVCTPTYNRRPFIASMIKCFQHQTYPKDKMEWIIIDDGTDKIEDLVKDIPQVKYFKYDKKMVLGKKRNIMHEKSCGDIIVYMDDDDYYPPVRVAHAVNMLLTHPKALCAGSSEIYIWFKHINQMIQFGPYGPNHATAGTFAFKRELLKDHAYDDTRALAEEKSFLKDYSVPFVQLEPKKTILVFSHPHNTFDKKTLLNNRHPQFVRDSDKTVDDFVKEPELKEFFMNKIEKELEHYLPGRPDMKPDVNKQMIEIKAERAKMEEDHRKRVAQENFELQNNPAKQQQFIQQKIDTFKNNSQLLNETIHKTDQMIEENNKLLQQYVHNQQIIHQNQKMTQIASQQAQSGQIMGNINGESVVLGNHQIVNIMKSQGDNIAKMQEIIQEKDKIIERLLGKE
jgi:hypothetical protein